MQQYGSGFKDLIPDAFTVVKGYPPLMKPCWILVPTKLSYGLPQNQFTEKSLESTSQGIEESVIERMIAIGQNRRTR